MTTDNFNYGDGPIEGTGSGTVSPRTLPSSTDDNFHADESWPHFQLLNSVAAGMPLEAPILYPYGKGPNASNGAVIVDDAGEMQPGHGFGETPAESMMFQQVPPSFPMMADQWPDMSHGISMENVPGQGTIPLAMNGQNGPKNHTMGNFQPSIRSLESRWLNSLESQLPVSQMTPASLLATHGPQKNRPTGQDGFQYKSENSSVSGDVSGVYECSYSATSDDVPAFTERPMDDDSGWKIATPGGSPPEASQTGPKTTAFMVSETPSESLVGTVPSRAKNSSSSTQRASGKSAPLAMQSVATVRKRKSRNANGSMDQGQPKPLQIVQEDGQGGSIASADFVSPPRGARRKGPLSMVGRANAGMRRKNKDTCVQCRLNKRKVRIIIGARNLSRS